MFTVRKKVGKEMSQILPYQLEPENILGDTSVKILEVAKQITTYITYNTAIALNIITQDILAF